MKVLVGVFQVKKTVLKYIVCLHSIKFKDMFHKLLPPFSETQFDSLAASKNGEC